MWVESLEEVFHGGAKAVYLDQGFSVEDTETSYSLFGGGDFLLVCAVVEASCVDCQSVDTVCGVFTVVEA